MSLIQLARNPTFHASTKHLEIHYHFICKKVLEGEIDLEYVRTSEHVANSFTKGLPSKKTIELCTKMGMIEAGVEREY